MANMQDGFNNFYNEFKNWSKKQLLHRIYDICLVDNEQITQKEKEIDRLNNILHEYEKIKKELLDYIYHNEYCRFGHIDGGEADEMRNIINKIDRLKEGEYSEK